LSQLGYQIRASGQSFTPGPDMAWQSRLAQPAERAASAMS
jgi:hypothetical protein